MKLNQAIIRVVAEDEKVVAEIAADIEKFISEHRHAALLRHPTGVSTQPFVVGGANDPGEGFDRQATRTSGVTVDVTQPGGVG